MEYYKLSSGVHTHPQHVWPLPPITNFNNCERKNSPARKLNSHFIATKKKSAPYVLKAKGKALLGNGEARLWMNVVDEIQKESIPKEADTTIKRGRPAGFCKSYCDRRAPPSRIHKQIVNRQLL